MKNNLMLKASRTVNKAGLTLKKYSPEIFVVLGIAGMVTSTVMACKATTKLNDILEESKKEIDTIKEVTAKPELLPEGAVYTEEDSKKDLTIAYTQTGIKLVKLYGPSVIVGALSITSIVASNVIMKKRNIALAAAYTTIDQSFKKYRSNVVERFGAEVDRQLKHNIKAVEIEKVITDENGEEKRVSELAELVDEDPTKYSEYARFFDEYSDYWEKDPEYNLMFLNRQQAYANDLLKTKGFLFLNDIYRMLGIPETKAGQVVGWIYNEKEPVGDNYIDFGIYDVKKRNNREFVNGYEKSILLDFNPDGNIWKLM